MNLGKSSLPEIVYLNHQIQLQNDCVDSCIKEIEIAFKWQKPAVISSHRVNYVGFINQDNADIRT